MNKLFNKQYNRANYLDYFKSYLLADDFEIEIEDVTHDLTFKPNKINRVYALGECKDLFVYEMQHESDSDPRVTISREAFKILRDYGQTKALVFFVSPNSPNYRLSLITIELKLENKKVSRIISNPRRYSYLLGEEAKLGTLFDKLVKGKNIKNTKKIESFDDLLGRFAVEPVTKEFFDKYKILYERVIEEFEKSNMFKITLSKTESFTPDIFARKLLGQITFLYFLQKKKWLGGDPSLKDDWTEGRQDFLRWGFDKCQKEGFNYFDSFLEKLFYEGLNKEGKSFSFNDAYLKVPYLNGGLFECPYQYDELVVFSPSNDLFSNSEETGILDIFDQYNFTIDENTYFEQDIAIDPEMLGKVFENLLDDINRKGKGAFYTPREIVNYMTRESLKQFLMTKLNEENNIAEKLEHLFEYKDLYLNKNDFTNQEHEKEFEKQFDELADIVEIIDKHLTNIKIADPAIGSGAFPMGILHEIVSIRSYIKEEFLDEKISAYELKKATIQNSIYGVDIDNGAIEIAKIRFWLSLVVDADRPEPLPNFDYKFMQGNSLIESFGGININQVRTKYSDIEKRYKEVEEEIQIIEQEKDEIQKQFFKELSETSNQNQDLIDEVKQLDIQKKKLTKEKTSLGGELDKSFLLIQEDEIVDQLHDLQEKLYFENNKNEQKNLREEIEDTIVQIFRKRIENGKEDYFETYNSMIKTANQLPTKEQRDEYIKVEKQKLKNKFKFDYDELESQLHDFTKKDKIRPFFPWHLYFADVFKENGGFDIVIGNPPYLKERENASIFKPVNQSELGIKYHCGRMDFWYYFLHKSIEITKENSIINFITSRYWLNSNGAKKLISHIYKELSFVDIVDIGKLKVFDNVVGHHLIHCYIKNKAINQFPCKKLINSLNDIISKTNTENIEISLLKNDNIYHNNEIILNKEDLTFNDVISLGAICDISQGVVEAPDKISKKMLKTLDNSIYFLGEGIFVLDKTELESLKLQEKETKIIKKYLDPSNVLKYKITFKDKFIIYSDSEFKLEIANNPDYIRLREHLMHYKDIITSSNAPFGLHRPRKQLFFESPKIIFKNMFKEPEFCYDESNYYFGFSLSSIVKADVSYDLKYILSILNSKFAKYWFYKYGKMRGVGVDVGVLKLRKFPIKKTNKQCILVSLVENILKAKKQEIVTRGTENIIDLIIYKLYVLTHEEIKIIDPDLDKVLSEFALTPEQYEKMSVEELAELEVTDEN